VHRLPLAGGGASCHSISYNGGPLIQKVKVVLLMWSSAAAFKNELSQFYSAIVDSPYLD
jgi:hypothetical protein